MERRLARGLDALLGKATEPTSSIEIEEIDVSKVVANSQQPRLEFESDALKELAGSIESNGLIQPIVVQRTTAGFELIAGERRLRAFQQLGRKTIPAIIRSTTDQDRLLLALVENLQRKDLNPIEEALAFEKLQAAHHLTHEQIASRVGRNRSTVSNTLRLLELPERARDAVSRGTLSAGHARALLSLTSSEQFDRIFDRIVNESLSVRDTEALTRAESGTGTPDAAAQPKKSTSVTTTAEGSEKAAVELDIETRLRAHWGVMVKARWGSVGGEIVFRAASAAELDYLVRRLEKATWPQQPTTTEFADFELET